MILTTFLAAIIIFKMLKQEYAVVRSGRIAMSALLVFTASGHFMFTKGMAMMIPFIPFSTAVVYATGVIELAAAVGLLIPKVRVVTAYLLIAFFIVLLPANVYAAYNHLNIQAGDYTGRGLLYLLYRIPLQLFFIGWIYFFFIKNRKSIS